MCCSQLLKLNNVLKLDEIEKLQQYFGQLTPNTSNTITVEKVASVLNVDYVKARKILIECKKHGIVKIKFSLKCPACGALIKQMDSFDELPNEEECYVCGSEIDISEEDIILLFSLNENNCPFEHGQHKTTKEVSVVAREDSLIKFLEEGNINSILYNPEDKEYEILKGLCEKALQAKTTTEKGDTLEKAVNYLFNMGKTFKARGVRTSINQIDCLVKNKLNIACGIFGLLGGCFYVECKNETQMNKKTQEIRPKTPSGSYLSKLHSIIMEAKGKSEYVRFGIIVSRGKAPSTYHEHAVRYKLANNVIIIHLTISEILELACAKGNLLDLIEEKAMMIIADIKEFEKEIEVE